MSPMSKWIAALAAVGGAFLMAPVPLMISDAQAAQAWSCLCKGERRRFLASSRHCEIQSNVPKGKFCSKAQYKAVFGPVCAKKGCALPPLN